MKTICYTCKKKAKYSIQLCLGPSGDESQKMERVYLPNQFPPNRDDQEEVWFCASCMRELEDGLRATILYLKQENGQIRMAS